MTEAISAHLTDIVVDVERVRRVIADDEAPHLVTEDHILSKLADISNLLDDLYNAVRGI